MVNQSTHAQKIPSRDRRRRVIFNNDGGDVSSSCPMEPNVPLKFLDVRTTALAESHVDTISYCTSHAFGLFEHATKVGTVLPGFQEDGRHALIKALIDQGTDALKVMVKFGRAHDMEVFWSMRMNDTHDGGARNLRVFQANRFKNENQDCLMGGVAQKDSFRKWSAVDYDHDKVRAKVLDFIDEICGNNDVDGIELDFFRHPVFFKTTALGRPVTDAQRDKITDMMRRISARVVAAGEKRGRSFVLAARTPDDQDYAAAIGLDIECWMRERLIDIYIPSCYFRLRSWHDSVELGHRYGVKVYPGLSDSRVGGGPHKDCLRASDECYRGRAANAWHAGADGIYVFNLFDPNRRIWHEIGDPQKLRCLDKLYFANVLGMRRVPGGAYPYEPFMRIPALNPENPQPLPPGLHQVTGIEMAEDLSGMSDDSLPKMTLSLKTGMLESAAALRFETAAELDVVFNGHLLRQTSASENWRRFPLDPAWARRGYNTVEVVNRGACDGLSLLDAMVGVDYSGGLLSDTSYNERTIKMM